MRLRPVLCSFFFFNDTATTEIYTLSLHDALPILSSGRRSPRTGLTSTSTYRRQPSHVEARSLSFSSSRKRSHRRSEEHTSELQSPDHLVCRLLLEKKNIITRQTNV